MFSLFCNTKLHIVFTSKPIIIQSGIIFIQLYIRREKKPFLLIILKLTIQESTVRNKILMYLMLFIRRSVETNFKALTKVMPHRGL